MRMNRLNSQPTIKQSASQPGKKSLSLVGHAAWLSLHSTSLQIMLHRIVPCCLWVGRQAYDTRYKNRRHAYRHPSRTRTGTYIGAQASSLTSAPALPRRAEREQRRVWSREGRVRSSGIDLIDCWARRWWLALVDVVGGRPCVLSAVFCFFSFSWVRCSLSPELRCCVPCPVSNSNLPAVHALHARSHARTGGRQRREVRWAPSADDSV